MEKKKWYYSIPAKTGIIIAVIISAMLMIGGVLGSILFWEFGYYTNSKSALVWEAFYDIASGDYYRIMDVYKGGNEAFLEESNLSYEILDNNGKKLGGNYDGTETKYQFEFTAEDYVYDDEALMMQEPVKEPIMPVKITEYTVKLYIDEQLPFDDEYAFAENGISMIYDFRYWIYPIIVIALIFCAACFVCLMCGAGRRNGYEGVRESMLARIPFDLYTGCVGGAVMLFVMFMSETFFWYASDGVVIIGVIISILGLVLALIGYSMNFAVRVKLGTLWRNTLINRVWHFAGKLWRGVWRGFALFLAIMPMTWRTLLIAFAVFLVELFLFLCNAYQPYNLFMLLLLEKAIIFVLLVYLLYCLLILKKGGKALADGDLNYQVKSRGLIWEFKAHADDLNSIRDGMNHAVNDRMKSERMKTELITNVSHDIKTPLTSIINYTDLIVKEQSENEKINEYAEVLARQSARLKKLIEDLVEASKASTGNLEVSLAPMEVGVMVTQAAGEYAERLALRNLTLITKQPEDAVRIMADGRHLWRVMDNLMNNVCKYAQPGTRVYLSVEQKRNQVLITLKNTSEYALDTEAEELMERFVRGDASRSTEGNGLGLSIAQSLTELQRGKMQLTVDGDLFKVVLVFPALEN